jgi:CheY-like chemotaxis protein
MVKGNPSELYEVLVNIIKNALEAMPKGGTLTISSEMRNGRIHLSVADTGEGISEENLQRLFQPFFTTKGKRSSGLGLSSSYGIVKKHQGSMAVKSALGQGSTFVISLPLAQAKPTDVIKPPSTVQSNAENKVRFLMIDDEINILKMMELYFEDTAVDLTTAQSAEKGFRLFCEGHFDAILCDFSMDGMNGLELSKAALDYSKRNGQAKTPFLLYTGLNQKLDPAELARCGVDHVVQKPIPCADLLHIVLETVAR